MTQLYFVRHCESAMNLRPDIVGGRSNQTPVTPHGIHQARRLGRYIHTAAILPEAVFSSGAVRTNKTARIALEAAGLTQPIIEDERLLELAQGEFEGAPRATAYTPENKQRYNIDDIDGKFPGGESILDVQQRMRSFLDEAHQAYPDGTLLVFGHGLAIRAHAGDLRGFTKSQILQETTANVSLTAISVTDRTPIVHYVGKQVISE